MRSHSLYNYENLNSRMVEPFSIFDAPDWLSDELFVHRLEKPIRELFNHLGGPKKVSEK